MPGTEADARAAWRLTESPNAPYPSGVSPDGRRQIFAEESPTAANDMMTIELDGTRRVTPLVQSPFNELERDRLRLTASARLRGG